MRNALLPPVSSQLCNFGNNNVQVPNLDFSASMDGKISVHGGSLYLDILDDDEDQPRDGEFGFSYQPTINYTPVTDYQSTRSEHNKTTQQSMVNPAIEMDFQSRQMRKRNVYEVNCQSPHVGFSDFIGSGAEFGEWRKDKTKKGNPSAEQWSHKAKESENIQERKVPTRRSQKLSDRITALQKLVSPYGKTDTAAVLQEAVFYIKLLQEQIENLFHLLRRSYGCNELRGNIADLRSKGLCLVPMSLTENVALQEDLVDPNAYLRNTILANDF